MKTTRQFRNMAAIGLLALTLAPATALTAQHGMPMGDRDEMPMMQQQSGGTGMMPGMQGGMPSQGFGYGMMGQGGMGMMGGCPMMGGMMGSGMGMGPGMMGSGMNQGAMGMMGMDLNPEQQTKMRRIQRDLRRQNWENMGRLMEAQEDLQELLAADSPDASAIGEAYARIAELKRPMIEARVKAMNEVRGLLTDEQREQMRSGPHGMEERRPGGMMGR